MRALWKSVGIRLSKTPTHMHAHTHTHARARIHTHTKQTNKQTSKQTNKQTKNTYLCTCRQMHIPTHALTHTNLLSRPPTHPQFSRHLRCRLQKICNYSYICFALWVSKTMTRWKIKFINFFLSIQSNGFFAEPVVHKTVTCLFETLQ